MEIIPRRPWRSTSPRALFRDLFRKRQFLQNIFVRNFGAPLPAPFPTQQSDEFRLEFVLKGPSTELRTLSQNCEQTLPKLPTNRITNKRVFLTIVLAVGRGSHKSHYLLSGLVALKEKGNPVLNFGSRQIL